MDTGLTISNRPPHRDYPQTAFPLKSIAAAVALMLSSGAYAADWTIVPSVGVSETYTDNVNLAPKPLAKSDYVTEIMPSISFVENGPYVKANVNYAMQEIDYAENHAAAQFLNQLQAGAKVELIQDLFFIDSTASVSQQNISALGAQPTNNIYATNNRTTVRTYNISPYLTHAFDAFATSELRYAFASTSADSGGLSTVNSDTVSFNVNSGPAFRILGWGLQYSDQITHYQNEADVGMETVSGNLSYLIAPEFKLTATAGYDDNNYASLGGSTKGAYWTTGFDWTVSPRTSVVASAGHRYYGNTFSLVAATRSRTSIWNLSYNESVTSAQSQFGLPPTIDTANYLNQLLSGTISDATQRLQAVNNIIQQTGLPRSLASSVNYFTNSVFLQKQLQASVALHSPKTTLVVSVFDTQRDPLSAQQDIDIVLGNDKTNQFGGSAVLSRRLSEHTSATVTLLASRVDDQTAGRIDRNQALKFGLTKQFSRKLSGTVELRRDQFESSQAGIGYRENAIATFLNFQL